MEHVYEDLVCWRITRDPLIFASRQYTIGGNHSCPDMVALNLRNKEVWIVEVSTNSVPKDLARRINDRDEHWIVKLKEMLIQGNSPVDESWQFIVKAFIRRDVATGFKRMLGDTIPPNVEINIIEDLGFLWSEDWWKWDKQGS